MCEDSIHSYLHEQALSLSHVSCQCRFCLGQYLCHALCTYANQGRDGRELARLGREHRELLAIGIEFRTACEKRHTYT